MFVEANAAGCKSRSTRTNKGSSKIPHASLK